MGWDWLGFWGIGGASGNLSSDRYCLLFEMTKPPKPHKDVFPFQHKDSKIIYWSLIYCFMFASLFYIFFWYFFFIFFCFCFTRKYGFIKYLLNPILYFMLRVLFLFCEKYMNTRKIRKKLLQHKMRLNKKISYIKVYKGICWRWIINRRSLWKMESKIFTIHKKIVQNFVSFSFSFSFNVI